MKRKKTSRGSERNDPGHPLVQHKNAGIEKKIKNPKFTGMQPGESFKQFSKRIDEEKLQMSLETANKMSHQRMKKKAYYAKRADREKRRKRRRRGELSDSDDDNDDDGVVNGNEIENDREDNENDNDNMNGKTRKFKKWNRQPDHDDDDDDGGENGLSSLPAYWQEIVRNNGRPISAKKRKRMDRLEKARDVQAQLKRIPEGKEQQQQHHQKQQQHRQRRQKQQQQQHEVRFGEQADRPPTFTVRPRKRGRQEHGAVR